MTGPFICRGAGEETERRGRKKEEGKGTGRRGRKFRKQVKRDGKGNGPGFLQAQGTQMSISTARLEEESRDSHIHAILLQEQNIIAMMMMTLSTYLVPVPVVKFFINSLNPP